MVKWWNIKIYLAFKLSDAVFIMLTNVKMPTIVDIFNIYEQNKCHSQLSWAWNQFYNLLAWTVRLLFECRDCSSRRCKLKVPSIFRTDQYWPIWFDHYGYICPTCLLNALQSQCWFNLVSICVITSCHWTASLTWLWICFNALILIAYGWPIKRTKTEIIGWKVRWRL